MHGRSGLGSKFKSGHQSHVSLGDPVHIVKKYQLGTPTSRSRANVGSTMQHACVVRLRLWNIETESKVKILQFTARVSVT